MRIFHPEPFQYYPPSRAVGRSSRVKCAQVLTAFMVLHPRSMEEASILNRLLGLEDQRCVAEGPWSGEAPRLGFPPGASGCQLVCQPKRHPSTVGVPLSSSSVNSCSCDSTRHRYSLRGVSRTQHLLPAEGSGQTCMGADWVKNL